MQKTSLELSDDVISFAGHRVGSTTLKLQDNNTTTQEDRMF